MTVLKVGTF